MFPQVLPGFQVGVIFYNAQWAGEHPAEARRWMIAYVKGLRYYREATRDVRVREEIISIMTAHTTISSRAVWEKMVWPGLRADGLLDVRSMLDFERWLLNEHQINKFVTPGQFIDLSYTRSAVRELGEDRP